MPPKGRAGGVEGGVRLPRAVVGGDGAAPDEDDLRGGCGAPESGSAGDRGGGARPGVEHHDPPGDAPERAGCGVILMHCGGGAARSVTTSLHATTPSLGAISFRDPYDFAASSRRPRTW